MYMQRERERRKREVIWRYPKGWVQGCYRVFIYLDRESSESRQIFSCMTLTEGRSAEALKPAQDYQQVQCESYGWELDGKFSQCLTGKQVRPQRLNKTTGTSGC